MVPLPPPLPLPLPPPRLIDVPACSQEDISRLRRKLEKQRKVEVYADADEILQEEIKEYKVRRARSRRFGK